jgi:hypothetical protein
MKIKKFSKQKWEKSESFISGVKKQYSNHFPPPKKEKKQSFTQKSRFKVLKSLYSQ